MRRLIIICLLALSGVALLATAPVASAAKSKSKVKPQITRVTPMRISVGNVLTIRGRNFKAKAKANTVIFRAGSGRTAFAKPRRASRTRLVVKVPGAVARLLTVKDSRQRPTRLKLRVLAGRFSDYTSRRLSPVVTGVGAADGGVTLAACDSSSDHDGDLLSNSLELAIKTDPCLRDTDKDGIEDGYEYQSALDLNHYPVNPPLPYPGKRPYPNALDPADSGSDYDGDGLTQREESGAWIAFSSDGVGRSGRPGSLSGLTYSDGLQRSTSPFATPSDALAAWVLDQNSDGQLDDDERDADGDGLGNWDEQHGRFTEPWWPAQHDGLNESKESKYPGIDFLDVGDLTDGLALVVADMDGDGILDGYDDHDRDGLSNQFEINRPDDWITDIDATAPTNYWAYVNPFNPCKPYRSSRCHAHPPFGYYASDEAPPIGPDPPAGYPAGAPTTPDG
ncbi:MAG: IPT/TIG domain-containing protein [Thermoleophilaceae bacterium]|nr:IPT/TIG domain-containing protein [Thermoleophilaceae bacterium]